MNTSHFSPKKIIAFSLILSLLFSSPIGVANAAAVIAEVTPVTQTGSNQTPSYTFSSDAVGTIDYNGGPCTSGTTLTVVGNNTITFDLLFENTYSTCQISVDDGFGISNILNVSPFVIDTTPPNITLNGLGTYNIPKGGGYVDSGAMWTDNVDPGNNYIAASGSVDLNQTGTYILEYSHTDTAGNSATKTRTVNVITGGIPSITLLGSSSVNINIGDVYVDSGATASDIEDGNITANIITVNPVDTNTTGIYTVTYNVNDSSSNPAPTVSRTVVVASGSAPTITLLGTDPILHELGTSFADPGATAIDLQDGDISPSIVISGSVDINTPGTYTLSYDVTDSNSNPAPTVTRDVIVADRIAPVVTLSGSSSVNVNRWSTYTDLGAIWTDAIDGSGVIFGSGTVNTGALGTYILSYRKIDAAGNVSNIVNRTVNVVTGAVPVITLNGSNPINILRGTTYTELGATASDTEDGVVPVTTSGSVNTNTPGVYTITYSATDSNLNTSTATRTVNVTTGGIPVVTLTGASTINVPFGTFYTELGASATDNEDGIIPVTISGTVNTGSYGTYILTYSVTDSNLNTMTATRTVRVIDTIPPVITLLGTGNITINAGSPYVDAGARWTDNIDGSGTITPSGVVNTNIAGLYILSYNYTDSSGNSGSFVTRQVTVAALANISYSGPGGGGGTTGYGMGDRSYPITMGTTSNSDLLIPSIARLLRVSSTPVSQSAPDSSSSSSSVDTPIHTVAEPVTSYICPTLKELYSSDDNRIISISEGEFTDDVRAMIMYRSPEGNDDSSNYSVRYLRNLSSGIVKNNEFYEGSRPITRAEFTKMLVRALSCHYTSSLTGSQFSDVGEHAWYTEYINFASSKGWISGYPDGTFHPHELITRGEAAKILAKAIQLETGTTITDASFIDVPESNGFAPYIYALKENNIIGGRNSTYYDMDSNISRNEVARIIHNTFLRIQ